MAYAVGCHGLPWRAMACAGMPRALSWQRHGMPPKVKECASLDFSPPAPAGVPPKPMTADVHLSPFIIAFLVAVEHGMKDYPVMCRCTVGELRKNLGLVERELRAYLRLSLIHI